MLFLVTSLKNFFAEHDIMARTLQGEEVGAWLEDNESDEGGGGGNGGGVTEWGVSDRRGVEKRWGGAERGGSDER